MIVIGIGQFLIWLGIWFMVLQGILPLWAGFILSTISTAFHTYHRMRSTRSFIGKHKNLKWLNAFVGQISLIPLAQSHHF